MDSIKQKIIDEYPEDYCEMLELAYGNGMMSGGDAAYAAEHLMDGINLKNKAMLEIGFGLGGLAFYFAKNYPVTVRGLEINPRMVEQANEKVSALLTDRLSFHCYDEKIPFPDNSFDIMYSKGVLCHVQNKKPLFDEVYRVLKPGGQVVIMDWLGPLKGEWTGRIKKMCELEDLTLFSETQESYCDALRNSGFGNIQVRNDSAGYADCNEQIANNLKFGENGKVFLKKYGKKLWQESIEGYLLIAEAARNNEIFVKRFVAVRQLV